jgi:predicted nucleic acid-binding protein
MLIDTNIFIYSLDSSSPKHTQAQFFLQNNRDILYCCQQNIFETMRVLTHSKYPHPFTSQEASNALQTLTKNFTVLCPTLETPAIAFELIETYSIHGTETFDAYLVATALSHQVTTIVSDNTKHLSKYKQIKIVNPFKVAE